MSEGASTPVPRKRGRPSRYTRQLADEICSRLANGETLLAICRDEGMPHERTVTGWMLDNREGFLTDYRRARRIQVEHWANEMMEIADDGTGDWYEGKRGLLVDHDNVKRSQLRIQTRQWLMARLQPESWGERVEHTGQVGGSLVIEHRVLRPGQDPMDMPDRDIRALTSGE